MSRFKCRFLGTCWITLLLQSKPHTLEYVGDFLIKYISHEISCYRSGIYEVVENRKEPQNYNYLPQHSIVCALGNYLKAMVCYIISPCGKN